MSENGRDAKPRGGYERQNGHRPAMNGNGNGNGVHRYDDDEEDPDYVHHFDLKAARGRLMDSAKNFKPPSKPVLHVEPKDLIKLKALTFDDMDLPEELAEGLRTTNYTTPTPVQSIGIPAGLEGNDVLTVAQTGSGKTLCFLLVMGASLIDKKAKRGPLNAIEPLGLAFTPTRELALQIMEVACTVYEYTPLRVCGAYGGIRQQKLLEEFEDQCRRRKLDAAVDILVGCPGRVQDLADRRKLLLERISFLVLDEADRLLDMGFQSQMDSIVLHSNMPRDRQTLFYSATFDQKELQFAKGYLKDDHAFVRQGVDRTLPDSLDVQFYDIAKGRETVGMVQSIVKDAKHQTLIFVGTKVDARAWGRELRCLVLHGDMTQAAREKSLESFRNDESTVLVATDVAQRGLDVPEVTDVVCVTLPNNEDDFLHRAGRTARCGRSGIMHLLIDRPTASLPAIVNVVEDSGIDVPGWVKTAARRAPTNRFRSRSRSNSRGRDGGGKGGKGGKGRDDSRGRSSSRGGDDWGGRSGSNGYGDSDRYGRSDSRGGGGDDRRGRSDSAGPAFRSGSRGPTDKGGKKGGGKGSKGKGSKGDKGGKKGGKGDFGGKRSSSKGGKR